MTCHIFWQLIFDNRLIQGRYDLHCA